MAATQKINSNTAQIPGDSMDSGPANVKVITSNKVKPQLTLARPTPNVTPQDGTELVRSESSEMMSILFEESERLDDDDNVNNRCDDNGDGKLDAADDGKLDDAGDGDGKLDDADDGKVDDADDGKVDDADDGKVDDADDGKVDDAGDGKLDGADDGKLDGAGDGKLDGAGDGKLDDAGDGKLDGADDGKLDGADDGKLDGAGDGKLDEAGDGKLDGAGDGKLDEDGDGKLDDVDKLDKFRTPDISMTRTTDTEPSATLTDGTATTEESSQDSTLVIPETPQSSDDELPLVPHDDYSISVIKSAKVHFRLRRTTPTLWRHQATCYTCMRVFAAIDDSARIAIPGVTWRIGDHVVTVLVVACLGYSQEPSRSAKVVDTRATEIIVRDAKFHDGTIRFGHMTKITAVKFFREGKPLPIVNTVQANKISQKIAKFITRVERSPKRTTSWLKIKPLIKPVVADGSLPREPTPRPAAASSAANQRKRRRELQRLERQRQQEETKRAAEMLATERRKAKNSDARRRRFVHKTVNDRVAALKDDLHDSVTERVAEMRNELSDILQEQLEHMKENLEDLIQQKCKLMQPPQPRRSRRSKKRGPPSRPKPTPVKPPPAAPSSPPKATPAVISEPTPVSAPAPIAVPAPITVRSVQPMMTPVPVPTPPVLNATTTLVPTPALPLPALVTGATRHVPPPVPRLPTPVVPMSLGSRYVGGSRSVHSYPPAATTTVIHRRLPVRRKLWVEHGDTDDESDVLVGDGMYETIMDRRHQRRHQRRVQRALERLGSLHNVKRRRLDDSY